MSGAAAKSGNHAFRFASCGLQSFMLARLIVQTVAFVAVMAGLLFVPAGTVDWVGAWAFIGEMAVASVAIGVWLGRHDPALLDERMSGIFRSGQARVDKALMAVFLALTIAWLPA